MGTALFAQNTNAIDSGLRKFVPPVIRGLEAIHFISGTASRAAHNYAMNKPNATIIGTPVESDNFLTLKGLTNYIQTQVADAPVQTIFRVVRTLDSLADLDHCPVFDGTYSGGMNLGTMFYGNTSGNLNQNSARFTDATQAQLSSGAVTMVAGTDIDKASFSLLVTVVGPTYTTVRNETKGTVKVSASNAFGRRPSTNPFRIGSAYESTSLYKGVCDVAFWSHHSVELSPAEIALNVARYRAAMQKLHGITV